MSQRHKIIMRSGGGGKSEPSRSKSNRNSDDEDSSSSSSSISSSSSSTGTTNCSKSSKSSASTINIAMHKKKFSSTKRKRSLSLSPVSSDSDVKVIHEIKKDKKREVTPPIGSGCSRRRSYRYRSYRRSHPNPYNNRSQRFEGMKNAETITLIDSDGEERPKSNSINGLEPISEGSLNMSPIRNKINQISAPSESHSSPIASTSNSTFVPTSMSPTAECSTCLSRKLNGAQNDVYRRIEEELENFERALPEMVSCETQTVIMVEEEKKTLSDEEKSESSKLQPLLQNPDDEEREAENFKIESVFQKFSITEKMRKKGHYVDVGFIVGEESDGAVVVAHRIVLDSIPFFSCLFNERKGLEHFSYPDVDPIIFEAVIRYFYSEGIEITPEFDIAKLFYIVKKFELGDYFNIWDLRKSGRRNPVVSEKIESYIITHWHDATIAPHSKLEYLNLSFDDFKSLVSGSIASNSAQELSIFESITTWVEHETESRIEFLPPLLSLIPMDKIEPNGSLLVDKFFSPSKLLLWPPDVREALRPWIEKREERERIREAEAQREQLCKREREEVNERVKSELVGEPERFEIGPDPESTNEIKLEESEIDHSGREDSLLLFPIDDTRRKSRYLEAFDFNMNESYRLHKLLRPREFSTIIQAGRHIFDIGGSTQGLNASLLDTMPSSRIFDICERGVNSSFKGGLCKKSRRNFAAAYISSLNKIYIIGGDFNFQKNEQVSQHVESLEVQEDRMNELVWTTNNICYGPRSCHGIALYSDKIFIGGGYGTDAFSRSQEELEENKALRSVEAFDPIENCWKEMCKMNVGRRCCRLFASSRGFLYAIGGESHDFSLISSVEKYDLETDSWSFVAPMNHGRMSFGVIEIDGLIYVIGGNSRDENELSIESYDEVTKIWTLKKWPSGLSKKAKFSASTTLTRDYVFLEIAQAKA